jgi:hypothetical protein
MKATCTWGDGPDVMINLDGTFLQLYEEPINHHRWQYGEISQGSVSLTTAEAEALASQLRDAITQAKELNNKLKQAGRKKSMGT